MRFVELGWYGGGWQPEPEPPLPPDFRHKTGPTAHHAPKDDATLKRVGVVLGRFHPPHLGHVELVEHAFANCGELHLFTVWPKRGQDVHQQWCSLAFSEWADIHVVGTEEMCHDPADPAFAQQWAERVRSFAPRVTHLFSSDNNGGKKLAQALGVEHVCIDPGRTKCPVSSTDLRRDIYGHFHWLAPKVRPRVAVQVALVGPESAGKSTLARELGKALGAPVVDDQLRAEATAAGAVPPADAFASVIRGAAELRAAAAQESQCGVVVSDNSALLASLWADRLAIPLDDDVKALARAEHVDLWIVCRDDFGFVGPPERDDPTGRAELTAALLHALGARPFVELRGTDGSARVADALAAVARAVDARRAVINELF